MNDLIADTLTRIQNAIMRKKPSVKVVNTKINSGILKVLKEEKMIEDFEEVNDREIEVSLIYLPGKEPKISHLERVSRPGQRIYVTNEEIIPIMNGRGISIITTSHGLMTGAMAKGKGLGGELICKIW